MKKKIKVLHIVGGLTAGGVETWLYNLLPYFNRDDYQLDFLTFSPDKGVYDEMVKAYGSKVYYFTKTRNVAKVANYYIKTVNDNEYDIVHSHRHLLGGLYLMLNKFTKAKIIIHSHNTSTDSKIFGNKIVEKIFKNLIKLTPNRIACSNEASIALFDQLEPVIKYGVDISSFRPLEKKNYTMLADDYGINENSVIVGHVGRFTEQKNHLFLLDIARESIKINSNYHFVLIGEGVLEAEIKSKIKAENLEKNVHLLGARKDVKDFMSRLFDIFLFPSLYEGSPVVLAETQAAALLSIISNTITPNVNVIPEIIHRVDLEKDATFWAQKMLSMPLPTYNQRIEYHNRFKDSEFSIVKSAGLLKEFYRKVANQS